MTQVPDFTSDAFKDDLLFKQQLTAILKSLNKDANAPIANPIQSNELIQWVDDGKTPIPSGYEVADGRNKTFDSKTVKIILIQKVI